MSKVLVTQSKIEDIADRLRVKTNISGDISLEQMQIDAAGTPSRITEPIPDYIVTEARRVANAVKTNQESCTNYVSFITLTDIHHLITDDVQSASDVTTSATVLKHCAMGAYLVSRYADVDFGIMLGDYINGGTVDPKEFAKQEYLEVLNYFSASIDLMTQGNHDCGMGKWSDFLSSTELYNRIGRFAKNPVRPLTEADRGYYYYDVPGKKFRVIVLNTNDIKGMAIKPYVYPKYFDGHRVSMVQLKWFRDVLLAMPSDYAFIVCSHEPIHWEDWEYTDANNVTWACSQAWRDILDAYVTQTQKTVSYTIEHESRDDEVKTVIDGETLTVDFRNTTPATLVGTFHGHTHNFITGKYGNGEIVRIGNPNACYGRTNEYARDSYSQKTRERYGELDNQGNRVTAYEKSNLGTAATETAFVVNTIDLDNKIIYSDYYGAGHNRVISYAPTIKHTVTKTLTNASFSNQSALVEDGESFTGTLTASSGYELKSNNVTIMMGSTNITSSAYNSSTGVVTIASVTDDVTITATGTLIPAYTNLVPTSTDSSGNIYNGVGYENGKRLGSDGTLRNEAKSTVSGFIPFVSGSIIRTKGNYNASGGNVYIGLYDSSKNPLTYAAFQCTSGSLANAQLISYQDGTYGWEIDTTNTGSSYANQYFAQAAYIRFNLYTDASTANVTSADQFILTLNEQIS